MTGGIGLLKQREIVRFRELILDLDAGAVGKPSLAGADINRPSGLGPGAEAPGAAAVGQKIGLDNLRTAAAGLLFQPQAGFGYSMRNFRSISRGSCPESGETGGFMAISFRDEPACRTGMQKKDRFTAGFLRIIP